MSKCRACGNLLDICLVDLGKSPIANNYLINVEDIKTEEWLPLRVLVCDNCWLAQTDYTIDPSKLFKNDYSYLSSTSASWLAHSRNHASFLIEKFKLNQKNFVLEIASNDGYLLESFVSQNIPCLGVEPTEYAAKISEEKHVPTYRGFYNPETAQLIRAQHREADIIIANNVLAHVPNPTDLLTAIRQGLSVNGVVSLEFPHLVALVNGTQFDTIYHEHYSYFSLSTVVQLAEASGLKVIGADRLSTHGGSLRVYMSKYSSCVDLPFETELQSLLIEEINLQVKSPLFYGDFQGKVIQIKSDLLGYIRKTKSEGLKIAAYGAAAKGNTLLNYLGLTSDSISFVVDKSPSKQGKYLPGSHIPITNEASILKEKPDIVLILPWNLESELVKQLAYIKNYGGKLVVPLPQLRVL